MLYNNLQVIWSNSRCLATETNYRWETNLYGKHWKTMYHYFSFNKFFVWKKSYQAIHIWLFWSGQSIRPKCGIDLWTTICALSMKNSICPEHEEKKYMILSVCGLKIADLFFLFIMHAINWWCGVMQNLVVSFTLFLSLKSKHQHFIYIWPDKS